MFLFRITYKAISISLRNRTFKSFKLSALLVLLLLNPLNLSSAPPPNRLAKQFQFLPLIEHPFSVRFQFSVKHPSCKKTKRDYYCVYRRALDAVFYNTVCVLCSIDFLPFSPETTLLIRLQGNKLFQGNGTRPFHPACRTRKMPCFPAGPIG